VDELKGPLPNALGDALRIYVGLTGALILVAAATTSVSGFTRLAHSLGEHGQLPRVFGRLNRRTLVSPWAILAAAGISSALLVGNAFLGDHVDSLASLYSFGVLLAFTLAQLAVIRLRFREPGLERPFRVPFGVRVRGVVVPLPAVLGAFATFAIWIAALVTHAGARYAGPAWLALGLAVYAGVRAGGRRGLLEDVGPPDRLPPGATFSRILAPLKLGEIGEEMVATAVALAKERGATLEAMYVIRVPLELPLDAPLAGEEERAAASLEEARLLGAEHGVEVETVTVHARAIGEAIVVQARERGVDLIVLGSAPRWRRQSAFFSPTVDYVLRNAPCEVLVVAFPQGVLEEV
jgi:APA family basic amino acid/polyamine antiporter